MSASATLRQRTLFLYAAPAFVLALPTLPAYVLLPSFYADAMGLGLTATGLALFIARLFDVLTDLPVGYLSDTGLGARQRPFKPLVLVGALIAGPSLYFLFSPDDGAGPWYLGLWAAALYLGWTLIQLPYLAWGAALSDRYETRTVITGWREAFGLFGVLAATVAPALMAVTGQDEQTFYGQFALVVILLGALAIAGLLLRVPEPSGARLRPAFRGLMANRLFLRLLAAWFVNGLANGIPAVLFPLFVAHVLDLAMLETGILLAAYFLSGVLAAPLWVRIARRVDKHRLWCQAMVLACLAFLWVPVLGAGDFLPFLAICIVTGATLGADMALPPSMQADVLDWDRLKSGLSRGGMLFAFWNMATKLALGVAVGLAFPLVEAAGFTTQGSNSENALLALALIYSALPCVLKLGAVGMIWRFPLGRRQQKAIARRLQPRPA